MTISLTSFLIWLFALMAFINYMRVQALKERVKDLEQGFTQILKAIK